MISSVDPAPYGVSRAKDWVSVDFGTCTITEYRYAYDGCDALMAVNPGDHPMRQTGNYSHHYASLSSSNCRGHGQTDSMPGVCNNGVDPLSLLGNIATKTGQKHRYENRNRNKEYAYNEMCKHRI